MGNTEGKTNKAADTAIIKTYKSVSLPDLRDRWQIISKTKSKEELAIVCNQKPIWVNFCQPFIGGFYKLSDRKIATDDDNTGQFPLIGWLLRTGSKNYVERIEKDPNARVGLTKEQYDMFF